jgi:hypothetical protein
MANGKKKPDTVALIVGHAVVGIAATWATAKVVKAIGPSLVVGVIAVIMHAEIDAPAAQVASDLGL